MTARIRIPRLRWYTQKNQRGTKAMAAVFAVYLGITAIDIVSQFTRKDVGITPLKVGNAISLNLATYRIVEVTETDVTIKNESAPAFIRSKITLSKNTSCRFGSITITVAMNRNELYICEGNFCSEKP